MAQERLAFDGQETSILSIMHGSLPFEPTWPTVKKWWSYGNKTYRYRLLSSYVAIWKENQDLLDDKVRATKRSYSLLVVAVGIILLQAYVYASNANPL